MPPENLPRWVDHVSLANQVRRVPLEEGPVVGPRHEAHLLGIRLGGHRQPEPSGVVTGDRLRLVPQRKDGPRQLLLPQHVQHVGLVLGPVGAPQEVPATRRIQLGSHVVPGGNEVHPQLVGALQESPELDVGVAPGAGIGGPAGLVFSEEICEDRSPEGLGQVHDLVEPLAARVRTRGFGRGPAAAMVHSPAVDQAHVRAEDVESLLCQQARGHRRVHPAGHGHQNGTARSHRFEASSRRAWVPGPAGILPPARTTTEVGVDERRRLCQVRPQSERGP